MIWPTVIALLLVLASSLNSAISREHAVLHFQGTTAADLNKLIAKAPAHSIIKLAPKTYIFDQTIIVNRSHLSIVGSGREKTRLLFRMEENEAGDFIKVVGGRKERIDRLIHSAERSAHTIKLGPGHRLTPGDVVYISRPNTPAFLEHHSWQGLNAKNLRHRPLREAIASVKHSTMLSIELANGLPAGFPKRRSTVYKIHAVRQVTLSDMSIQFDNDRPNSLKFDNTIPGVVSAAAIRLKRTVDSRIERVNIIDTISKGIALDSSLRAVVDDVRIDGSHNKGTRGEGYGIELRETFDSELGDLTILNTRHAVVFSSWHMEAGNKVHIRRTNRDLNFHGGLDHSNEVTINEMRLGYDMNQRNGRPKHAWSAVSSGGRRHPNANFFANNIITMKSVTSSWRNDILIAGHDGSKLKGDAGYDVLIGGRGADIVSGGDQPDVFLLGEGHDIIVDFEPGNQGDTLWLPFSFLDLPNHAMEDSRGLLIRWQPTFSILLNGITIDQLDPSNIRLCTQNCVRRILARRFGREPGTPQL